MPLKERWLYYQNQLFVRYFVLMYMQIACAEVVICYKLARKKTAAGHYESK